MPITPSPPRAVYTSSDFPPAFSAEPIPLRCDSCDRLIDGEPGGQGVYLQSRGGEVWLEPVPLCRDCATAIGVAVRDLEEEDEEG